MYINFGLFPPLEVQKPVEGKRFSGKEKARAKKLAMANRALADTKAWLGLETSEAAE